VEEIQAKLMSLKSTAHPGMYAQLRLKHKLCFKNLLLIAGLARIGKEI
jgi:hypothetical protein